MHADTDAGPIGSITHRDRNPADAATTPGPIAEGLHLLGGSVAIDERISWYPAAEAGRHLPFNSYLLADAGSLLLLEAGVPAVFPALAAQLDGIARAGQGPTRLAVTRNEPDCVANIPGLVRLTGLRTVHSPGLLNTLQFFSDDTAALREGSFLDTATELQMLDFGVTCARVAPGDTVPVSERRGLEVIQAPLRVLPTVWYYDRLSRTLFCSDSFSDETAAAPDQRLLADVAPHDVLVARCLENFALKFDWLARSRLAPIIGQVEAIFARHDIETLAPSRGLVIRGAAAVRAKQSAMLAALRQLESRH
ncbi:hypothetical protein [Roseicella frigidaeris]|uniref:Metallo-beta-lactamase domain-containing protein n=1 Tax=Roseicella frigidaeris TaxID=2230885 RepID=A0A327M413_9PROT|nr:hypothetical protein [Roseicella frigidaeris]RAI57105.1 hypothetical protein DOO78_20825 [Roseicella frigidaeris]